MKLTVKNLRQSILNGSYFIPNKTKKYLNNVLKYYGKEFVSDINSLYPVASGISDNLYEKITGKEYKNHLFILVWVDHELIGGRDVFSDKLDILREYDCYEADYPFDHPVEGYLHMLVFTIPEEFKNSIDEFKKGKYSRMYTIRQITKLFPKTSEEYLVLTKNNNYKKFFENKLNSLSKDALPGTEIVLPEDAELDYLLNLDEEIFNYE